jgi:hypothetical protein
MQSTAAAAAVAPRSSRAAAHASLPPLRVLTLGDGNFSFSAALASMHDATHKRIRSKGKAKAASGDGTQSQSSGAAATVKAAVAATSTPGIPAFHPTHQLQLTATSYDSAAALHAKYPEAARLIEKLLGAHGAKRCASNAEGDSPASDSAAQPLPMRCVEHDVDATNLSQTLLPKLLAHSGTQGNSESASVAASASAAVTLSVPPALQFDVIIFNHPHSGTEDLNLHSSLLAHFFHSASKFLRLECNPPISAAQLPHSPGPQVHVTLCQRQPEEWHLISHASNFGFRLISRSEFLETHYPGYETKRHHVNKTFARKTIQRMELFIFQRKVGSEDRHTAGSDLEPIYARTEQDSAFEHNLLSHVIQLPTFKPTLPYEQAIAAITSAGASSAESAAPSLHTEITCSVCHKGFASDRGLFYHKKDVHGDGSNTPAEMASIVELQCLECDPLRTFKAADALKHHRIARHSAVASAAPSSARADLQSNTISVAVDLSAEFTCPICPLRFDTANLLQAHLDGVRPVAATQLECATCGRLFSNARALTQHERASVDDPTHVRIVLADTTGVIAPHLPIDAEARAAQGRSKMKKLRGMAANPENKQSIVQRLQVKKMGAPAEPAKHLTLIDSVPAVAAAVSDPATEIAAAPLLGSPADSSQLHAMSAAPSVASPAAASPAFPCSAADCSSPGVNICTRCRASRYCSQACQKRDWPAHKRDCGKVIAASKPSTSSFAGFPGLEEELAGSRRDLDGICQQLRQLRPADMSVDGAQPHTLQAVFAVHFKEPPRAEDASEQQKLDMAARVLYAGVCLPAGYALLSGPASFSDASPVPLSFVSPLLICDSLHSLLMQVSPVYSQWKADELNRKLQLMFEQQNSNADD